ncbi:uncharacterized protein LOC107042889 [Diachasma alloeum]|uniref:uncharacterized protein LOC107042889 n=1 Tax=Diachasma alloeum TaxID=454923 RepID=UPI0007381C93|nr:uncharacterized protein LOC107042889 [Diachasma alloeum]
MMIIWILALCASVSAKSQPFKVNVKLESLPYDDAKDNDYFKFDLFDIEILKDLDKDIGVTLDYTIFENGGGKVASESRVRLCPDYDAYEQDVKAIELFKGALDILHEECTITKRTVRLKPTFDTDLVIENLTGSPCDKIFTANVEVFPPGSAKKIVKIKYLITPQC